MMPCWTQLQVELLSTANSPGDFEEQLARAAFADRILPCEERDNRNDTLSLFDCLRYELRKKHS